MKLVKKLWLRFLDFAADAAPGDNLRRRTKSGTLPLGDLAYLVFAGILSLTLICFFGCLHYGVCCPISSLGRALISRLNTFSVPIQHPDQPILSP
jgi:hypothetical protein